MKKYLALVIMLLVSACETAPDDNSPEAKMEQAMSETVSRLGSTTGMTKYTFTQSVTQNKLSYRFTETLFVSDTEIKSAAIYLYDGEVTDSNTGKTHKFDNEIIQKIIIISSYTKNPVGSYTFVDDSGNPITDLKSYTHVYKTTTTKHETWRSSHQAVGGTEQWDAYPSSKSVNHYLVKEENGKLYLVFISQGSTATEFTISSFDRPAIYVK